jgi:hypothetical protein
VVVGGCTRDPSTWRFQGTTRDDHSRPERPTRVLDVLTIVDAIQRHERRGVEARGVLPEDTVSGDEHRLSCQSFGR